MTDNKPEVSIIITLYNLGEYIDDAVNSVLEQTFQDFEIILINDGSTEDLSIERAKYYQEKGDPKIKVLHESNRGVVQARNYAFSKSNGAYLVFLDADDKLTPEFLEKTLIEIKKDAKIGFVTSNYTQFGKYNNSIRFSKSDIAEFLVHNCAHTSSPISRLAFERVGGYDKQFTGYMDWDLWLSIIQAGFEWRIVDESLFLYRVREGSMVTKSIDKYDELFGLIFEKHKELYAKYFDKVIPLLESDLRKAYKTIDEKQAHIDRTYQEYIKMSNKENTN